MRRVQRRRRFRLGRDQWLDVASNGVAIGADRITLRNSRIRNVRFGIGVGGNDARIQHNLVDGFSADGMRGLGDNGLFEYNIVKNNYVDDPPDGNHDDGFQSWSVGPGGVGTGEVRGVTLRGNVFISVTNPNHPLRSTMQGIGCFDGFFVDWVVENNVVVTDHWHGISFLGMRDSRIVNNTVIDINSVSPGPPWIMVAPHKDGRPSENVVVRNNLATDYSLAGTSISADHNLEIANPATYFVAPPYDLSLAARCARHRCRQRFAGAGARCAGSSAAAGRGHRPGRVRTMHAARASQVVRSRRPLGRLFGGDAVRSRENSRGRAGACQRPRLGWISYRCAVRRDRVHRGRCPANSRGRHAHGPKIHAMFRRPALR